MAFVVAGAAIGTAGAAIGAVCAKAEAGANASVHAKRRLFIMISPLRFEPG
jgi:hypothetical protein